MLGRGRKWAEGGRVLINDKRLRGARRDLKKWGGEGSIKKNVDD